MDERNVNPDALLQQLEEEEAQKNKGRLKIFFGYAAGIGKTYAMLEAAQQAKAAGVDVVAGYIEPHTRPDTMALVDGLEVLPPLRVDYNHITLKEFDLDGALRRRPQLMLVDELAHTNARGCRHQKRYQDIKELINAGIDVYTTVNVQHLESLNDIIAGITGIVVKERIPDSVFDEAAQVELVDIEPEDLLIRLKQGKIYKARQASRAMQNFFTLEHLISLREIALRRMADRVNLVQGQGMRNHSQGDALSSEHILICLSPSPSNEKVIRQAARMASAFHGKFTALYVETPDFAHTSPEDADRLKANIHLAEQLGAKTVTSYGSDIVQQIAEYSRNARVTKIVLGRTYTKRSWFYVRESFADHLTKLAPQLEIFLIPDTYDKKYERKKRISRVHAVLDARSYAWDLVIALLIMGVATGVSYLFSYLGFNESNFIMIYLLGVLVTSLLTNHFVSSSVTSILCVIIFNFCFTDPKMTLSVNNPEYIITFAVMFLTALISTTLTKRVKGFARETARKAYRTEILLETSQKLQKAADIQEIAQQTAEQLGKLLERNILFYLGNPQECEKPFLYSATDDIAIVQDKEELAVAEWTYKNNQHAGFSTRTLPGAKGLYLAVRNSEKVFAVVGIDMQKKEIPAFELSIMSAILNECALALEKEELVNARREAAIQLRQEQFRANLLRSISHDLRTPLTSISGNASVLIANGETGRLNSRQRQKLSMDIYDDSMWLINLVENLLSVTRIENGTMQLNLQTELLGDIINEALKHVDRKSEEHQLAFLQEDDMLMAKVDVKLIMQVIINLVDNAIKYTPKGSKIVVSTRKEGSHAVVQVADDGSGICDSEKQKLFHMFYTAGNPVADGRRGMGLGLALCKSIVNAHGGEITVTDNYPRGTMFTFNLKAEEVII